VSLAAMLNVGASKTLPNWFNMHSDLCVDWAAMHMQQPIGGQGHIVQIDETLVAYPKRMRNARARPMPQWWVFGGLDTSTQEAFLVEVPRHDTATLLPIIQLHVAPGTTIWSDQWAAYRQITAATGLQHATVNHSLHFVQPQSGVNTNAVENLWRCAKDKFERMHGTSQAHILSYLDEFQWRRNYGSRDECFENAVQMLRWRYRVPQ